MCSHILVISTMQWSHWRDSVFFGQEDGCEIDWRETRYKVKLVLTRRVIFRFTGASHCRSKISKLAMIFNVLNTSDLGIDKKREVVALLVTPLVY